MRMECGPLARGKYSATLTIDQQLASVRKTLARHLWPLFGNSGQNIETEALVRHPWPMFGNCGHCSPTAGRRLLGLLRGGHELGVGRHVALVKEPASFLLLVVAQTVLWKKIVIINKY